MSNRSNREQKMYVTGDTHGDEARMRCREFAYNQDLQEGDILFICGDFGYIFNDSYREHLFLKYLANK